MPDYFIAFNENGIIGIMLIVEAMVGLPFTLLSTFFRNSLKFLNEDLPSLTP